MKTIVLGIGNLLLRDEGVGIHAVRQLQKRPLPQDVEVVDAGTASWYITPYLKDSEKLIVIDAVKNGGKPGTIYRLGFDGSAIQSLPPLDSISLHQIDFFQSLIGLKNGPKEIIIFGIEPKEISWGMELSREVDEKISELIELAWKELALEVKC